MHVKQDKAGLLILPETEFEVGFLRRFACGDLEAFLKHGVSVSEVVGLRIRFPAAEIDPVDEPEDT